MEYSFGPSVDSILLPSGGCIGQNNINVIDPTPTFSNVNQDDLNIFVSLKAKTKGKTIVTQNIDNEFKIEKGLNYGMVDFVNPRDKVGDDFVNRKFLTTKWTDVGGISSQELGNDFETFGITNIDIQMKADYTPKVIIDFVDIRGSNLFEQGSCSPYGVFFHLPYPVFELTVKGFYGRPIKWYLNLVKFNTKFNSSTGNFESRAEFIGYSYAFLADMLMGYALATHCMKFPTDSQTILKDIYQKTLDYRNKSREITDRSVTMDDLCGNGHCITIIDLLTNIKKLEVDLGVIKGSNSYDRQQDLILLKSDLSDLESLINDFKYKATKEKDFTEKTPPNFLIKENDTTADDGIFLQNYWDVNTGLIQAKISTIIDSGKEKEVGITFTDQNRIPVDKKFQNKVLTGQYGKMPYQDEPLDGKGNYIDLNVFLDQVKTNQNIVDDELDRVNDDVNNQIEAVVKEQLGFIPTVNNIFIILASNVELFVRLLQETTELAEKQHDTENLGDSIRENTKDVKINNTNNLNENKIWPWPTYYENGVETYPGKTHPNWFECKFVEEFIKAYQCAQDELEVINGDFSDKPGYDNYFPINPIESPYYQVKALGSRTETKYHNAQKSTNPLQSIYRIIGERAFVFLDHTLYNPLLINDNGFYIPSYCDKQDYRNWSILVDDLFPIPQKYAEVEAFNILNSLEDGPSSRDLITMLSSLTYDKFKEAVETELIKTGELTTVKTQTLINNPFYYPNIPVKDRYVSSNSTNKATPTKFSLNYSSGNDNYLTKLSNEDVKVFKPKSGYISIYPNEGVIKPNPHEMFINDLFLIIDKKDLSENTEVKIQFRNESVLNTIKNFTTEVDLSIQKNHSIFGKGVEEILTEIGPLITVDENNNGFLFNNGILFAGNRIDTFTGGNTPTNTNISSTSNENWKNGYNPIYLNIPSIYFEGGNDGGSSYYFGVTWAGGIGTNSGNEKGYASPARTFMSGFSPRQTIPKNRNAPEPDITTFKVPTTIDGIKENFYSTKSEAKWYDDGDVFKNNTTYDVYGAGVPVKSNMSMLPIWLDNVNEFRKALGVSDIVEEKYNLAYLFLTTFNSIPPIVNPMNKAGETMFTPSDLNRDNSIRPPKPENANILNFNQIGGIVEIPKFWLLAFGAYLWRWTEFNGGKDPLVQPGYSLNMNSNPNIFSLNSDGFPPPSKIDYRRGNILKYINTFIPSWSPSPTQNTSVFNENIHYKNNYVFEEGNESRDALNWYRHSGSYFDYFNLFSQKGPFNDSDYYDNSWATKNGFYTAGQIVKNPEPWLVGEPTKVYRYKDFAFTNKLEPVIEIEVSDFSTSFNKPQILDMVKNNTWWPIKWMPPWAWGTYAVAKGPDDTWLSSVVKTFKFLGWGKTEVTGLSPVFPSLESRLEYHNFYGIGDNDLPEVNFNLTTESSNNRKNHNNGANSQYNTQFGFDNNGGLGLILKNLPSGIKEALIGKFKEYADNDFKNNHLPIIDPLNFQSGDISKSYTITYDNDSKLYPSLISMLTPLDSTWQIIVQDLVDSKYVVLNSTPKIWWGNRGTGSDIDFSTDSFMTYDKAYDTYLRTLHTKLKDSQTIKVKKEEIEKKEEEERDETGLSITTDNDLKLSLYRSFKSINDKWITSSNEPGKLHFNIVDNECQNNRTKEESERTLANHFTFVNRLMGDIGDQSVLNVQRLKEIFENPKESFYQVTTNILAENKFNFFAMPSFYNFTNAKIFGQQKDGDFRDELISMFSPQPIFNCINSGPQFIGMYVGGTSRILDMPPTGVNCSIDSDSINFTNDSFDITADGECPPDMSDNKNGGGGLTAFRVTYGNESQTHFKSIQLDQSEFSETNESLMVIDALSKKNPDSSAKSNKGQNLFSLYLTRSYTCTVEAMGNVQIQPMMYFELKNVPMFHGTYIITEVSHNVKPNYVGTTFKGVRQPIATVPIITEVSSVMDLSNIKSIKSSSSTDKNKTNPSTTTTSAQFSCTDFKEISEGKNKSGNTTREVVTKIIDYAISTPQFKSQPKEVQKEWLVDILTVGYNESKFNWKTSEGGNYSPVARIREIFGGKVKDKTDEQLQEYVSNEKKLFNLVYCCDNHNGNEQSGDGYKYRGRGLTQTTFKSAYEAITKKYGVDVTNNPDLLFSNIDLNVKVLVDQKISGGYGKKLDSNIKYSENTGEIMATNNGGTVRKPEHPLYNGYNSARCSIVNSNWIKELINTKLGVKLNWSGDKPITDDKIIINGINWVNPLNGIPLKVTSTVIKNRSTVFGTADHQGLDIDVKMGDDVKAVANGTVKLVAVNCKNGDVNGTGNCKGSGYGLYLIIDHGKGTDGYYYKSLYGHLSKVEDFIINSDKLPNLSNSVSVPVTAGQVIGKAGGDTLVKVITVNGKKYDTAGGSTGSHLHLEIRRSKSDFSYFEPNGSVVVLNPINILPGSFG